VALNAFTLLIGCQDGHSAYKNMSLAVSTWCLGDLWELSANAGTLVKWLLEHYQLCLRWFRLAAVPRTSRSQQVEGRHHWRSDDCRQWGHWTDRPPRCENCIQWSDRYQPIGKLFTPSEVSKEVTTYNCTVYKSVSWDNWS